nr:hypothetical protein GCM10020241_19800 [Streptoalloteichus tenebrarius]
MLALACASGVAVLLLWWGGSERRDPLPERTGAVVVVPGESVMDVARRAAPRRDPDAVARRIRELNAVDGVAVAPGQTLVVPVDH